jgi:predicted esterase/catechol 2,3-dioxygenase-like lactoylglutathione lyase family enzyme
MPSVLGIHHVTAISSEPQRTLDFYAGVLGLRFVKRTVNFDDPRTYHFYFADEVGTPGSVLTFFPWPGARRGRQGTGQAVVTTFAAPRGSIGFWVERLVSHGVAFEGPAPRRAGTDSERGIAFADFDGLMLEIVGVDGAQRWGGWAGAPGIPVEHSLRGFHGVTLWERDADATERVLVDVLGFRNVAREGSVRRYVAGADGPGRFVDARDAGDFPGGLEGAGTVHHVAFQVADEAAQLDVRARVVEAGLAPTPVIDRTYFRSVYFREPGGVLFELATVGPGFEIDESAERLGAALMLPPQYETHRAEIEAALPPIVVPVAAPVEIRGARAADLGFVHHYEPAAAGSTAARPVTLLMLHGTGGDERDLLPLGRMLAPGAAVLSPRGGVEENGMPRFFRRHEEGVFDLEDLARRTEELAAFVEEAADAYRLDRSRVVAVGFSNGANIAVSLLLRRPGLLSAAILLSPMLPYDPGAPRDLDGTSVFIGAGRADPFVPAEQVERLAAVLRQAGAGVDVRWNEGGHGIARPQVDSAREWLARLTASPAYIQGSSAVGP